MATRTDARPGSALYRAADLASWLLHPAVVLAATLALLSARARPGAAEVLGDLLVLAAGLLAGAARLVGAGAW